MKSSATLLAAITALFLSSCGGNTRIEPVNTNPSNSTGIFNNDEHGSKAAANAADGPHQVEVLEVLNTDKYSYLKVKENEDPYWIATMKANFVKGEKYEYQGGLLKTNFKSTEFDRVFDKVYLVSQIRPLNGEAIVPAEEADGTPETVSKAFKKPDMEGLVDLKTIVKNPEKYNQQTVRVYGEVVKVNPNIMDRNWLHIKDGTADDFDFVITSQTSVPVGHAIVFEGTIATNKDFGAGYSYELIMENAKPIQ